MVMVPFSDTRWQRSRTEMAALAAAASLIQKTWRCNQLRDRFRTVVQTAVKRFCSHFDEGTEVDRGAVDTGRSPSAFQKHLIALLLLGQRWRRCGARSPCKT